MTDNMRTPVRTIDQSGREIIRVPLAKAIGMAVLDAADFDQLMALGLSPHWYLNGTTTHGYVRAGLNTRGKGVGVARVILGVGSGRIVKYRDGDPTNLIRSNLVVAKGAAKRTDVMLLRPPVEHHLPAREAPKSKPDGRLSWGA